MATEAQRETGSLWLELVEVRHSLLTLQGRARYSSDWAKVRRFESREKAIENRLTILKENS